jgi:5'-3' exonuclease
MGKKKAPLGPPTPHVLCIDGHNFLHRSRAAQIGGDFDLIYIFFRSLRSLIEKMRPTRVYFVMEGVPEQRLAAFPEYKANRWAQRAESVLQESAASPSPMAQMPGDWSDANANDLQAPLPIGPPPAEEGAFDWEDFDHQKELIVTTMRAFLPITILRHPRYECDDVIANIVKRSSASVPWTIVSNDTDFIQLLNDHQHVKLYDPMRGGRYQEVPPCDYVLLKSLTGDGSDNIPGIKGIGPKTAIKMLQDPALMEKKCLSDPELKALYERNQELIRFHTWKDEELLEVESATGIRNWDCVKELFDRWKFASITADDAWLKFTSTFDVLWAVAPSESEVSAPAGEATS